MTEKRCVGYARVSTEKQDTLEGQESALEQYARGKGDQFLWCYHDSGSGENTLNLEGFKKLQEKISSLDGERKVDELLVTRIDRLSRNSSEFEEMINFFNRQDILIRAIDNPDASYKEYREAVKKAQEENQKKRKKTSIAKKNQYCTRNKAVFGYKFAKEGIVIDEEKAVVVKRVFEMYVAGKSYSEIKKILGKNLSFSRILKDQRYIGLTIAGDVVLNNIYPPIVSRELFEHAKLIREEKKSSVNNSKNKKEVLFKNSDFEGMLYCKKCGQKLTLEVPKGKSKNEGRFCCPSDPAHLTKRKTNVLNLFLKYVKNQRLSLKVFAVMAVNIILDTHLKIKDLADKREIDSSNTRRKNGELQFEWMKKVNSGEISDKDQLYAIELISEMINEVLDLKNILLLHFLARENGRTKRVDILKTSYPAGFLYDGKELRARDENYYSTADINDKDWLSILMKLPEGAGKLYMKMISIKIVMEKYVRRELGCFKEK